MDNLKFKYWFNETLGTNLNLDEQAIFINNLGCVLTIPMWCAHPVFMYPAMT